MGLSEKTLIRQAALPWPITINGMPNWEDAFSGSCELNEMWTKLMGRSVATHLEVLHKVVEINGDSLARSAVSDLLTRKFVLEELEVEFVRDVESAWGKCVWYKEHPKYLEHVEDKVFKNEDPSFMNAMFRTEHAGDQKFSLYSLQMFGACILEGKSPILLHKSIVYHKVVLSPPNNS